MLPDQSLLETLINDLLMSTTPEYLNLTAELIPGMLLQQHTVCLLSYFGLFLDEIGDFVWKILDLSETWEIIEIDQDEFSVAFASEKIVSDELDTC